LVAVAGVAGAVAPVAPQQQTLEQVVAARRVDYEAAKKEWEAASLRFKNVDRTFQNALDQFRAARRSGSQEAIDRAFAEAQSRSAAEAEQSRRVKMLQAKLEKARKDLSDALSKRLEQLLVQLDSAPTLQKRQALNATFTDLNNELRDLDTEAQDTLRLSPVVLPDITYDPRDTSQELEQKAEILELRAQMADTLIDDTRNRIKQLQERQRRDRQRRDFMAGTGRFDDTHTPVIGAGAGGDEGAIPVDSTGANAQPVTLEQRIEALQAHVQQLEAFRDQLRVRAAQFRSHVRMVT
jgi:ribosomal protein L12E/L44/L45/RPP1/RPP2